MHSIFETLDFATATDSAIDEAAAKALDRYAYEPEWRTCLTEMVRQVLTTPISSPSGSFTLGSLSKGSWST